jgi:putative membrane protein
MPSGPTPNDSGAATRHPVDSRLLQANERTLLAWLRTGIALMTFGFVIARIGVWLHALAPNREELFGGTGIGTAFVALGVAAQALAVRRFLRGRAAIVAGSELAQDGFPVLFGVALTVLGALLGAYVLFWLR